MHQLQTSINKHQITGIKKECTSMAKKVLVAVFSASGVTKKVGTEIARIAQAYFQEIIPGEIYT